ncbi:hypothetical protein BRD17_01385 [Halobacteriales archaeon SW_7_68_16]|nr:MAG: hypothetical protein BRD17_01385 [Halobacteriales archaeon SW_7_68_16]
MSGRYPPTIMRVRLLARVTVVLVALAVVATAPAVAQAGGGADVVTLIDRLIGLLDGLRNVLQTLLELLAG